MVFRFLLLSDEVEDFRREIKIDADSSFLDLHNIILKSVDYKLGEMSSFFICDNSWTKEAEVTLVDMDTSSEEDSNIMETTTLSDFLEDEKQKLMFVFDYMSERAFYMELREIIFGENIAKAVCSKSVGIAPEQFIEIEEEVIDTTKAVVNPSLGEEFYGEEGYNLDELDADGFDGLEDNSIDVEDIDF